MSDTGHTALVRVKPLEWETRSDTFMMAAAPELKLYYGIAFIDGSWVPQWTDSGYQPAELSDIMAAAQADYERRILSAIEPSPSLPILVEALEKCAAARPELNSPSDYSRGWNAAVFRIQEIASAALTSIKGGDNA